MNYFRRLNFALWYFGRAPWDSGIVPPEVEEFISAHPPGIALDLGCGSGTSSIALARARWCVTGVDFIPRAIRLAKLKAKNQKLDVEFLVSDVTHLPPSIFNSHFSLVLDIGCFHGLNTIGKESYLAQLPRLLAPGGMWLLYGFIGNNNKDRLSGIPHIQPVDIERAGRSMILIKRQEGKDRKNRASAWFWFERKP
jgi:SAM-dependent methyltransferase